MASYHIEDIEHLKKSYADAQQQHQEIAALLPIGFYADEKLSSRVRIMRQHWDKLEPLMQENTKLKRVLKELLDACKKPDVDEVARIGEGPDADDLRAAIQSAHTILQGK